MRRLLLGVLIATAFSANAAEEEKLILSPDQAIEALLGAQKHEDGAKDEAARMREQAIREAGKIYGSQMGWKARWREIEIKLHERTAELNKIFNFSDYYLRNGTVQPPILDTAEGLSDIRNDGKVQETVGRVYRVRVDAKFSHTPLTWRDYLLPGQYPADPVPQKELLPENEREKAIWRAAVTDGWSDGEKQVNSEFSEGVAALHASYQGMALYTALAMRGMIEAPQIEEVEEKVTDNKSGKELVIGRKQRVIARDAYFVTEPDRWKALAYLKEWGSAE